VSRAGGLYNFLVLECALLLCHLLDKLFFLTPTTYPLLLLLLVGGCVRLAVLVGTLSASPGPLSAKKEFELIHLAAGH
jgi:hypothetical protein